MPTNSTDDYTAVYNAYPVHTNVQHGAVYIFSISIFWNLDIHE